MMKRITIFLLLFLSFHFVYSQTEYEKEIKIFFSQILVDEYTYTFKDFILDSVELSKKDAFWFEYDYLKSRIDTSPSRYMLRTDYGKMHFDSILIVKEPMNYYYDKEIQNLRKYLARNTILQIINPFLKTIDKSINAYIANRKKGLDYYIDTRYITQKEIDNSIKKGNHRNDIFKKYGTSYIRMTLPIFSSNYEYAVFDWSYHCGRLCGYGYSGIYIKENGKWTCIKVMMSWIS